MDKPHKGMSIAEAFCGLLAILLGFILACACQVNMHESPVNGVPQGSSYTPTALGNPDWVARHPRLAQCISTSSVLSGLDWVVIWPSALLYMTGYYPIPVLCVVFLAWRAWVRRKAVFHAGLLALAAIVTAGCLPFLKDCVIVMMD